jgi:hypothetical protein
VADALSQCIAEFCCVAHDELTRKVRAAKAQPVVLAAELGAGIDL